MTNINAGDTKQKNPLGGWTGNGSKKAAFVVGKKEHMQNRIQYTYAGVVSQVAQAILGVDAHGGTLNLALVDSATMTTTSNAMQAGEIGSIQAKAELVTRQKAYNAHVVTVRKYVTAARDVLKPHL